MTKTNPQSSTAAAAEATLDTPMAEPSVAELRHDARLAAAENSVKNYVIAATTTGLVPAPLIDLALVTAIQIKMVHALCKHYDVKFTRNIAKSVIGSLVGGVLSVSTAEVASSLLKFVPVVGYLAGGASIAITSGALTYALGQVFIMHFESGGTLLSFNARNYHQQFKEQFEAGGAATQDLRTEPKSPAAGSGTNPV